MAEAAPERLTFEGFTRRNGESRYELVAGRLKELPLQNPSHAWAMVRLAAEIGVYLQGRESGEFYGVSLDIPTIPDYGRRPDLVYYSAADAARGIEWNRNEVTGVPALVVEVVSPEHEERDTVTKRAEYARGGISHYWILDPQRRTALALRLEGSAYAVAGRFAGDDILTSELFPGLEIPLKRLFR